MLDPRGDAGGLSRESPACRNRRLKGRRYIDVTHGTAAH